jgi:hypothetical protein
MDYGTTKRFMRDRVPVQVIRGFYPTEPGKLSSLAAPIDAEAIKSGMVIVKDVGTVNGVAAQPGFRKADAADATAVDKSFFIALHDDDSHDVQAANGLVGLDCSDDYEIQTGYFDAAITWLVDLPLTVGADGIITEATAGDAIIGYITKIGTATNNTIAYQGKTPSATLARVIQFKTAKSGQVKA